MLAIVFIGAAVTNIIRLGWVTCGRCGSMRFWFWLHDGNLALEFITFDLHPFVKTYGLLTDLVS